MTRACRWLFLALVAVIVVFGARGAAAHDGSRCGIRSFPGRVIVRDCGQTVDRHGPVFVTPHILYSRSGVAVVPQARTFVAPPSKYYSRSERFRSGARVLKERPTGFGVRSLDRRSFIPGPGFTQSSPFVRIDPRRMRVSPPVPLPRGFVPYRSFGRSLTEKRWSGRSLHRRD